jgi:hypothetical protein
MCGRITGAAGFICSTGFASRSRQSQRRLPVASFARLGRDGTARRSTGYDVLILDAAFKQSLASVRSLGRAGLRVAAAESIGKFNLKVLAQAFWSQYCQGTLILSDLVADTPGFVAALTEFVTEHSPRVITADTPSALLAKTVARRARTAG